MSDQNWYYDVKAGTVVQEGEAPAKNRLGPYATREEAANALETIRKREERKSAEDRAWENGEN
ncbi:hypothetical protein BH24ACT9_BH24ACT9_11790 [soil metagenome]|jgi:hypothetical protein